jgi:hypothetical protein
MLDLAADDEWRAILPDAPGRFRLRVVHPSSKVFAINSVETWERAKLLLELSRGRLVGPRGS